MNKNVLKKSLQEVVEDTSIPIKFREIMAVSLNSILEEEERNRALTQLLGDFNDTSVTPSDTGENKAELEAIGVIRAELRRKSSELLASAKTEKVIAELKGVISGMVAEKSLHVKANLTQEELVRVALEDIINYGELQPLINDSDIEEIQVDDYDDIWVIRKGIAEKSNVKFKNAGQFLKVAEKMVRNSDQVLPWGSENPFIRLRLGDTTRVSIMRSPIARRDSAHVSKDAVIHMTIRKQKKDPFTREELISFGSIDENGDKLLSLAMKAKQSTVFFGETNTGKTAMMTTYASVIERRIITIAEIDEMNLRRIDTRKEIFDIAQNKMIRNPNYLTPMKRALMWEITDQSKKIFGNMSGFTGGVNASLTFSPETQILQEVKSGEVKDVMEASITGSQAILSTHANSNDALTDRIILMYTQSGANLPEDIIKSQIPSAFNIAVHVQRYEDGTRKLATISEILKYENGRVHYNILYQFVVDRLTEVNGKKKVLGSFYLVNEPSPKMMDALNQRLSADEMAEFKVALDRAPRLSSRKSKVPWVREV